MALEDFLLSSAHRHMVRKPGVRPIPYRNDTDWVWEYEVVFFRKSSRYGKATQKFILYPGEELLLHYSVAVNGKGLYKYVPKKV